ncbi:MAG: NADH-quinone oxidoreductase subunit J [Rickettsiales bacterium]|nr:NADH-quinone oxidoreductase subunit J [Rickettsiales bacterium]
MNFTLTLFYLFSFILLSSSMMVVSTRNMVYSVMFLILCFVNAAALFLLVGAEFLAMLVVVVYVGAIAVLFLFVVMMLNVDIQKTKEKANTYLPVLIMIGVVLFAEILLISNFSSLKTYDTASLYQIDHNISNVKAIGNVLYTDFIIPFQLSGAILFVAMIGAIALTLKENNRFIRKQVISNQTARNKKNSIENINVKTGEGIEV